MSESSALWLQISPDWSRSYFGLLSAAHLLALIGGLTAGLAIPLRAALVAAVIASWIFHLRGSFFELTEKRPFIVYGEQDGWSFRIGKGPDLRSKLLASSISTRWITILHFRTELNRFQSFVIFPDSLNAEDYRKLRMILRVSEKNH